MSMFDHYCLTFLWPELDGLNLPARLPIGVWIMAEYIQEILGIGVGSLI